MNVDPNEIKKFNQFADTWWDPNGAMKPLHQLNPLRLQYIENHVEIAAKKILDVGCGGGILAESMARCAAYVTAIDLSEGAIQVAEQHAEKERLLVDYQCTSIETIATTSAETFDIVTCMELLEHVPDPARLLGSCAQVLKPGGTLFVSTINRNLKSYFTAIVGAEYLLDILPKGTHEYAKFIRPSELTAWARQAGLKLIDLQGVHYRPFAGEFDLTDSLSINYLAYYEK